MAKRRFFSDNANNKGAAEDLKRLFGKKKKKNENASEQKKSIFVVPPSVGAPVETPQVALGDETYPSIQLVNKKSLGEEWNVDFSYLEYNANFDYLDKGDLGVGWHSFGKNGIGCSFMWHGIYSFATEKWLDTYSISLGPNFSKPISKSVLFYAPLCANMESYSTIDSNGKSKSKIAWSASFIPSIALRSGHFVFSFGWIIKYSFEKNVKDRMTANVLMLNIGWSK